MTPSLMDTNAMLAFSIQNHSKNSSVIRWLDSRPAGSAILCRVTQMSFLRLITNPRVVPGLNITPFQAWKVYREVEADERFLYVEEPRGLDRHFRELTANRPQISGSAWTDLYLYAFAVAAGFTLATFDKALAEAGPHAELIP